jgi:actin cytoskeleton-regulatory complex protein SLA1
MGFIGVYRAIYDYSPQAAGELTIEDGDLLYIIEKGDGDGWWKAKKKAGVEDEDEPVGLVPHNYIEIVSIALPCLLQAPTSELVSLLTEAPI